MAAPFRAAPLRIDGTVTETLPNAMFRVRLDGFDQAPTGPLVMAHVAAELRMHVVRILPGDRVTVEISRLDGSRGRIVRRV